MNEKILNEIVLSLSKANIKSLKQLDKFKRKISADFRIEMIKNSQLLSAYNNLIALNKLKRNNTLAELLKKRKIRTLSGVAPIAVLTKPYPCPGNCIFCPTEKKMPKSYLSNEPAVMRAVMTNFDPYQQVKVRISALKNNGHCTDKIELIVMGGTWSYFPQKYQKFFIKRCFEACNGVSSKTLKQAQKINETTKNRIVGLTLETRPDYINKKEIIHMRNLGCTKVELGIQAIDDYILQLNNRNSNVKQIISATKLLKNSGFKILYHIMPNLYGSTVKKDFEMFKKLFTDQNFQPDMLKIYPCVVTEQAKLHDLYLHGKYQPYSDDELTKLLVKIKKIIPEYVRITRLIRDIPKESIIAGNKISNLREIVQRKMKEKNLFCKCIRCREAKNKKLNFMDSKLSINKYKASKGDEYFLQYTSKDKKTLYAFLRLRISKQKKHFIPELKNAALIREVHTYGQMVGIDKVNNQAVQHAGFGKKLIKKAEQICKKQKIKKLAVISGIGVRKYYEKLGYQLEGTYMVKFFE